MTPEAEVKLALKRRLGQLEPSPYQLWPVPMGYGERSLDVFVCCKGQFIAIECKAPRKKLRRAQAFVAISVIEAGGKFFLIDSVEAAWAFDPDAPSLTRNEIILRSEAATGDLPDD